MGALDKISNMFKFSEDDDFEDYDDYEEEEIEDFEPGYEEDEESSKTRNSLFKNKKEDDVSFDLDKKSKSNSRNKIVPIKTQIPKELEVVVIKPQSMEDAKEITDTLLYGKAVVLNLEGIHVEIAQRIIDYSAGSTYAIRGNLQKITNFIFLVTPPNVDISGDIPELVGGGIDLTGVKSKTEIGQI
ncbi:cell division protein SepF [Lachnospira multipara]|jgi:cell division inhibitor SepF|uniref:cell division protein SepF n=1 Tax=Lachnospira multipara TaxID=28051 RepID=UPI0004805EFE|nr:cell division protein SepF [Lachnospira multipara]